jgi:hypothetical protein
MDARRRNAIGPRFPEGWARAVSWPRKTSHNGLRLRAEVKRHRLAPQLTPQTMYPGFRGTPLAARSQRTEIVLSLNVLTADDIIQIERAGGVYGRFEYTDPILKRANSCPVTAQHCE